MTANVNHLHSKDARKEWEKLFNASYIEPVLSELEAFIAGALDLVIDDAQQGVILLTTCIMRFCQLYYSRTRQIVLPGLRIGQG